MSAVKEAAETRTQRDGRRRFCSGETRASGSRPARNACGALRGRGGAGGESWVTVGPPRPGRSLPEGQVAAGLSLLDCVPLWDTV